MQVAVVRQENLLNADGTLVAASAIKRQIDADTLWRDGDGPVVIRTRSGASYTLLRSGRISGGTFDLKGCRFEGSMAWNGAVFAGKVIRGFALRMRDEDPRSDNEGVNLSSAIVSIEPIVRRRSR